MEETKLVLGYLVKRHLMFVLAALLSEGAYTFMNPLVAINLGLLRCDRGCSDDAIDMLLRSVSLISSHDSYKWVEK